MMHRTKHNSWLFREANWLTCMSLACVGGCVLWYRENMFYLSVKPFVSAITYFSINTTFPNTTSVSKLLLFHLRLCLQCLNLLPHKTFCMLLLNIHRNNAQDNDFNTINFIWEKLIQTGCWKVLHIVCCAGFNSIFECPSRRLYKTLDGAAWLN